MSQSEATKARLKLYRSRPDVKDRHKRWVDANRQRVYEINNRSKKKCASRNRYDSAVYRARKAQSSPKWLSELDKIEIKLFYANCPKGYHVDHIIPLKGRQVTGLHVLWNLQYLPARENIRKGNRIWTPSN